MKQKNLMKLAAMLAVIASLAVVPAHALTTREAKELKATVLSVPLPEMPAKGAELVLKADKADRVAVAVTVVKAVVAQHRAAAPLMVSAISKAAPEVAPAITVAAVELSTKQEAAVIARAATIAAPSQAKEISAQVNAAPMVVQSTGPIVRGAASSNPNPNATISNNPIGYDQTGKPFNNTPPTDPGTPTPVQGPRQL